MPAPEEERTRIAAVYSAMSDEELRQIAASGDELSDAAHEAFAAEIAKRDLHIEIAPLLAAKMLLSSTKPSRSANSAISPTPCLQGSLESAGIHAYLVDDNMIRMDWFISNLTGRSN